MRYTFIFVIVFFNFLLAAQPKADFSADVTTGCGVVQSKFQSLSTGKNLTYSWNFGTGSTSTISNPIKIFFTPGQYKVCLTVKDSSGLSDTKCKDDYISVYSRYVPNFAVQDSFICEGSSTGFKDLTISPNGPIVNWIWDLGGSAGVVQQNTKGTVTSRFDLPGNYAATLSTIDVAGCKETFTKQVLTVISRPVVGADFGSGVICDTAGKITITNKSPKINGISFEWDFGNGQKFSGYNPPVINYSGEGKYNVILTAVNQANNCSSSATFYNAVTVENLSKFQLPKVDACLNETLNFKPGASIQAETHVWDFGNGQTALGSNVSHSYLIPGCYKVRHTITNKGCKAEQVSDLCINVHESPKPDFTIDKNKGCDLPLKIKVNNLSKGSTTFAWKANGQTISKDSMPVLSFADTGTFSITLKSTNQYGCSDSIDKGASVLAYKVKAQISSPPISGCVGTVNSLLSQNSSSVDPIALVQWKVFTNTPITSNQSSFTPTFTINDTGAYKVQLKVTNEAGCSDSIEAKDYVLLGIPPESKFLVVDTICYGSPLKAKDTSSAFANSYQWTVNPGGNYSGKTIDVFYNQVTKLIITEQAFHYGCKGNIYKDSVQVIGAKADFETIADCNQPLRKVFKNNSSEADRVHWDFGVKDTTYDTSTVYNPAFIYPKKDNYLATLTVQNSRSNCPANSSSLSIEIKLIKANIAASSKEGCAPFNLKLNDKSVDAVNYKYDFANVDQTSSKDPNPNFIFSKGGLFKGQLIVNDKFGCADTLKIDSINVHTLTAGFEATRKLFCQDSTLSFRDKSTAINDSIVSKVWTIGDKSIKDSSIVNVLLDQNKTPSIKINLTTSHGCTAESSQKLIVNKLSATATSDTLTYIRDSILFVPKISGEWTSLVWDFGDGTQSNKVNTYHTFKNNAIYKTSLLVKDDTSGCSFKLDSAVRVVVGSPKADFLFLGGGLNCKPYVAKFDNKSLNAIKFKWDFGDQTNGSAEKQASHLYTLQGVYSVRLIASSTPGCTDTSFQISAVRVQGPLIKISTKADPVNCVPATTLVNTTMTGVQNALIDWGDGKQDSLANPNGSLVLKHTFKSAGEFLPVLVAQDTNLCIDFALVDTFKVHEIHAGFKVSDTSFCGLNSSVGFIDNSFASDKISKVMFRIKGNTLDTVMNTIPTNFSIPSSGQYSVTHLVANQFCSDTLINKKAFSVYPRPSARIVSSQSSYCLGDTIHLINRSRSVEVLINDITWEFNGLQSKKDSFNVVLKNNGMKTVSLIVKNEPGCKDTAVLDLAVKASVFAITPVDTTLCAGSKATLRASLINPVVGMHYSWNKDSVVLCTDCLTYQYRPTSNETFSFKVTDPGGCSNIYTETVKIFANNIGNLGITKDTTICAGELVPMIVDAKDNLYVYHWDSTAKGLSCYEHCRNPIAHPEVSTQYRVLVMNEIGCEKTDSVFIKVKPKEVFDLGTDHTICKGDSFKIEVPGLTNVNWSGASGISCTNCNNPVIRPLGNLSKYILKGFKNLCPVTDSITFKILSGDIIQGSPDTTVCIGSLVNLKTNYNKISWSPTLYLSDPALNNPVAKPDKTILYRAGYSEDLCTITDTIRINVIKNTDITVSNRTVCPGQPFTLTANGEADKYNWIGENIISDKTQSSVKVKATKSGIYQVIAQNKTCVPDTGIIQVNVIDFISLDDSITYHVQANLQFQLNKMLVTPKQYKYQWSPSGFLSCKDCKDPIFLGDKNVDYQFTVTDPPTGCSLDQKIKIEINTNCNPTEFFSIPNIFTPNHDGLNDILFAIPKSTDQLLNFRIYDRAGDLLFESHNASQGWDGRFKGKDMPNAVYLYSIETLCPQNNKSIFLTGDVTLLR